MEKVCEELKLRNCNLSFNIGTEKSPYNQEEIQIRCSLTDSTHKYYVENPAEASMRIALYLYKNSIEREGVFPYKILKVGVERNDTTFSIQYEQEELEIIFLADKVVNEFVDLAGQNKKTEAELLVQEGETNDSIPGFFDIIKQSKDCAGEIVRREFIGAYFDQIEETKEDLLVYSMMIYRENDTNLVNCYILNSNHKIVYLEVGHNKPCE